MSGILETSVVGSGNIAGSRNWEPSAGIYLFLRYSILMNCGVTFHITTYASSVIILAKTPPPKRADLILEHSLNVYCNDRTLKAFYDFWEFIRILHNLTGPNRSILKVLAV